MIDGFNVLIKDAHGLRTVFGFISLSVTSHSMKQFDDSGFNVGYIFIFIRTLTGRCK